MNSQMEFFKETYIKVLSACLGDEAIKTLKQLQTQQYFLLRLNELFSEIFVSQREDLIKKLTEQNYRLKNNLYQHENKSSSPAKFIVKDLKTENIGNWRTNEVLLIKQNQSLKIQINDLRNRYKIHIEELEQSLEILSNQLENQRAKQNTNNQSSLKRDKQIDQKIKQLNQDKKSLSTKIQNLEDLNYQLNKKQREMIMEIQAYKCKIDIILNQNKSLNEERILFQGKILRLEQSAIHQNQIISNYQKEINTFKNLYQAISTENKNKPADNTELYSQEDFMTILNQKENNLLELKSKYQEIQEISRRSNEQMSAYKFNSQIKISQLTEALKKATLKIQRDQRIVKQQGCNWQAKYKQMLNNSNQKQICLLKTEYEISISNYKDKIQMLEDKIKTITKQFNQTQQIIQSNNYLANQQIEKLKGQSEQIKKIQRQLQRQIKSFTDSEGSIEKQLRLKIQFEQKSLKHLQDELLQKNKQNQLLIFKLQNLQKLHQTYQNRQNNYSIYKNNIHEESLEHQKTIQTLKQQLMLKQNSFKELNKKLSSLTEQLSQQNAKYKDLSIKLNKLQVSLSKSETDLLLRNEQIVKLQQKHKEQIDEVYEKGRKDREQVREQTQNHFTTILKQLQKKQSLSKGQQDNMKIKNTIKDLQTNLTQKSEKVQFLILKLNKSQMEQQQTRQKYSKLQQKYYAIKQSFDSLTSQNTKQKQNSIHIVKCYENQLSNYRRNLKDFKFELYLSLKQALDNIKGQCQSIITQLSTIHPILQNQFYDLVKAFETKNLTVNKKLQNYFDQIKVNHNHEIRKIQNEIKEIRNDSERNLKQKNIQIMTIMAEKEYQINSALQRQKSICKKYKEIQSKYIECDKQLKEQVGKSDNFRQIIKKIERKLLQSERQNGYMNQEIQQLQSNIENLKDDNRKNEVSFKEKLERCRQKYMEQNEKLFARYEKQFSKLILNTQRSKQIPQINIPTSSRMLHCASMDKISSLISPTQGKQSAKLQYIKNEIDIQKKRIREMSKKCP